jgi:hypothetical protein
MPFSFKAAGFVGLLAIAQINVIASILEPLRRRKADSLPGWNLSKPVFGKSDMFFIMTL